MKIAIPYSTVWLSLNEVNKVNELNRFQISWASWFLYFPSRTQSTQKHFNFKDSYFSSLPFESMGITSTLR